MLEISHLSAWPGFSGSLWAHEISWGLKSGPGWQPMVLSKESRGCLTLLHVPLFAGLKGFQQRAQRQHKALEHAWFTGMSPLQLELLARQERDGPGTRGQEPGGLLPASNRRAWSQGARAPWPGGRLLLTGIAPSGDFLSFRTWESRQGPGSSPQGGVTSSEFFPGSGLPCILEGKMPSPRPFPKAQIAFKRDRKGLLLSRKILYPKL